MSDFKSRRFRDIKGLEHLFSKIDKWTDISISPEDRERLRYVFSTKWTSAILKEIERIFPDRSEPKDENNNKPTIVVKEKFDGANLRYSKDTETGISHYRSRNKVLANAEDKKNFFNCEKTLRDCEPYINEVFDRAIEKGLIPKDAKEIIGTFEVVAGATGDKDRNYYNSREYALEIVPLDLSFKVEGQGFQSVPHTENWWDVGMEGFKIAQQAPKPLLVTKNLGAALECIAKLRNTKSTLCDLIDPSKCGNGRKEGCVLRVFTKDETNEMYKYVYSGGIAPNKFEKELRDVVANAISHHGSNFDVEDVTDEAVNSFIEELKNNPALRQIARKLVLEKKDKMDCEKPKLL